MERADIGKKDRILKVIYEAVDDVNEQLSETQKLQKDTDTALFDGSSKLDSLGLISLIVATEGKLCDEFQTAVAIVDERAMSQKNSPFRTIDSLADYVAMLLQESSDE
jgi:D-alanine--poly(phosphoribitol) ligase subunit 2